MSFSASVARTNNPSRSLQDRKRVRYVGKSFSKSWTHVRDSKVENFTRLDENIETIRDLLDGSGPVPPVQVQDIDVISLKLGERISDLKMR